MPVFVALFAAIVLRERPTTVQHFGLTLILGGALAIVVGQPDALEGQRILGHALFVLAALLWACFTVVMQRSALDPLHAAALVAAGSLALYLPFYGMICGTRLTAVPLGGLAMQALFQGVLVTIVSLLLYGRAIAILGASGGAAFGALVPAVSALIAIPLLGEWPDKMDWIGITLISAGVYLASGGPMPGHSRPTSR
jgi:drug/metabolite transporter (DMT)-like permease